MKEPSEELQRRAVENLMLMIDGMRGISMRYTEPRITWEPTQSATPSPPGCGGHATDSVARPRRHLWEQSWWGMPDDTIEGDLYGPEP